MSNDLDPLDLERDCITGPLAELDIPDDCGCPAAVRWCPHIAEAPDHGVSLEQWGKQLAESHPFQCEERPLPAPSAAVTKAEFLEVMIARQSRGEALRHPGDAIWSYFQDRILPNVSSGAFEKQEMEDDSNDD